LGVSILAEDLNGGGLGARHPDVRGHALGSRASSGVTGPTGVAQVDAVAAHGDMFLAESLEL